MKTKDKIVVNKQRWHPSQRAVHLCYFMVSAYLIYSNLFKLTITIKGSLLNYAAVLIVMSHKTKKMPSGRSQTLNIHQYRLADKSECILKYSCLKRSH